MSKAPPMPADYAIGADRSAGAIEFDSRSSFDRPEYAY
jgi:hypothetical protein